MTALRDCTDPATWWPHVDEATKALAVGGLVVLPTDTVYGIAADAFQPAAVQALLDAKGRGRQMPPPVLIGDVRTMDGLADAIPDKVREMVTAHWPGPLTVILRAQPSLQWDLGETNGTVALRMPDHELALAVLRRTGPLAVSSANATGSPAATTAAEAASMLGESVRVYLDGGASPGGVASTIVDATGPELRIVREGALSAADLGIDEPAPAEDAALEEESGTAAESAPAAKPAGDEAHPDVAPTVEGDGMDIEAEPQVQIAPADPIAEPVSGEDAVADHAPVDDAEPRPESVDDAEPQPEPIDDAEPQPEPVDDAEPQPVPVADKDAVADPAPVDEAEAQPDPVVVAPAPARTPRPRAKRTTTPKPKPAAAEAPADGVTIAPRRVRKKPAAPTEAPAQAKGPTVVPPDPAGETPAP